MSNITKSNSYTLHLDMARTSDSTRRSSYLISNLVLYTNAVSGLMGGTRFSHAVSDESTATWMRVTIYRWISTVVVSGTVYYYSTVNIEWMKSSTTTVSSISYTSQSSGSAHIDLSGYVYNISQGGTIDDTTDTLTLLDEIPVTYSLTNAYLVSGVTSIPMYKLMRNSLTFTINANTNASFENGVRKVSMGGIDVFSSSYSDYSIFEPRTNAPYECVTGNIEVTANAILTCSISYDIGSIISSSSVTSVIQNQSYSTTLTPSNSNKSIQSVVVTMDGVDVTSLYVTNTHTNGVWSIDIPTVTGDVVIEAIENDKPIVTYQLTNATLSSGESSVHFGDSLSATITANSGYTLENSTVNVIMNGEYLPTSVFDTTTGVLTISEVTGDITVQVSAEEESVFDFRFQDGTSYLHLTNINVITTLKYEIEDNVRTITINGDVVYVIAGQSIPSGYKVTGLTRTEGGTVATVPTGYQAIMNIHGHINFYEVVTKEQDITSDLYLNLYRSSAEKNRLDKTSYLTSIDVLKGVFREGTTITEPTILIEREAIDFNYVYIEKLRRYYYLEEAVSVKNRLWLIRLKVDVLMTYKSEIRNQKAYISRYEKSTNYNLVDSERIVFNNPIYETISTTTSFSIGSPLGGDSRLVLVSVE